MRRGVVHVLSLDVVANTAAVLLVMVVLAVSRPSGGELRSDLDVHIVSNYAFSIVVSVNEGELDQAVFVLGGQSRPNDNTVRFVPAEAGNRRYFVRIDKDAVDHARLYCIPCDVDFARGAAPEYHIAIAGAAGGIGPPEALATVRDPWIGIALADLVAKRADPGYVVPIEKAK